MLNLYSSYAIISIVCRLNRCTNNRSNLHPFLIIWHLLPGSSLIRLGSKISFSFLQKFSLLQNTLVSVANLSILIQIWLDGWPFDNEIISTSLSTKQLATSVYSNVLYISSFYTCFHVYRQ